MDGTVDSCSLATQHQDTSRNGSAAGWHLTRRVCIGCREVPLLIYPYLSVFVVSRENLLLTRCAGKRSASARSSTYAQRTSPERDARCVRSSVLLGENGDATSCISAWPKGDISLQYAHRR